MSRKNEFKDKKRASPTATVAHLTEDFMASLKIPPLPDVPDRLAEAVTARVQLFLFHLREAKHQGHIKPFEVRLIRDALGAVLTAFELHVREAPEFYAEFHELVLALGYVRTDIGFMKPDDDPTSPG
jgi:hypothetical protein